MNYNGGLSDDSDDETYLRMDQFDRPPHLSNDRRPSSITTQLNNVILRGSGSPMPLPNRPHRLSGYSDVAAPWATPSTPNRFEPQSIPKSPRHSIPNYSKCNPNLKTGSFWLMMIFKHAVFNQLNQSTYRRFQTYEQTTHNHMVISKFCL